MKVVFFTSAPSNTFCGVVDYTKKLSAALAQEKIEVSVETPPEWSSLSAVKSVIKHTWDRETIFHLQYPSMGMGMSVIPGLLPVLLFTKKHFVMMHEFSIFNILRKMSFIPHALFSKKIIFSNQYEANVFKKYFPFAGKRTAVIPIGINIPVHPVLEKAPRDKERIIYFGQILEGKGIEFYLDTIKILRAENFPFDAAIIGAVMDTKSNIYKLVSAAAERDDITLIFNGAEEQISTELQKSSIAVLPFPDGITEKRGSALACLKHDIITITKHSGKTPDWLQRTTHQASSPQEASKVIHDIANQKIARFPDKDLLDKELALREWDKIAQEHIRIYKAQ